MPPPGAFLADGSFAPLIGGFVPDASIMRVAPPALEVAPAPAVESVPKREDEKKEVEVEVESTPAVKAETVLVAGDGELSAVRSLLFFLVSAGTAWLMIVRQDEKRANLSQYSVKAEEDVKMDESKAEEVAVLEAVPVVEEVPERTTRRRTRAAAADLMG